MSIIRIDLTKRQIKALNGRVLIAVHAHQACSSCDATFTQEDQRAFDAFDNDHCPICGEHGCCTTYYGDPGYQTGECALVFGAADGAFVHVVKRASRKAWR